MITGDGDGLSLVPIIYFIYCEEIWILMFFSLIIEFMVNQRAVQSNIRSWKKDKKYTPWFVDHPINPLLFAWVVRRLLLPAH